MNVSIELVGAADLLAKSDGAQSNERANVRNAVDFLNNALAAFESGDYDKFLTRLSIVGDFATKANIAKLRRDMGTSTD